MWYAEKIYFHEMLSKYNSFSKVIEIMIDKICFSKHEFSFLHQLLRYKLSSFFTEIPYEMKVVSEEEILIYK